MGSDGDMLGIVNSANVACGYHAGDPAVMLKTVAPHATTASVSARIPGSPICRALGGGAWTFQPTNSKRC